jgi:hypothetical protein
MSKLRNNVQSSKQILEPVLQSVTTSREWVETHGFQPHVVTNAAQITNKRIKAWFLHESLWETQTNGSLKVKFIPYTMFRRDVKSSFNGV